MLFRSKWKLNQIAVIFEREGIFSSDEASIRDKTVGAAGCVKILAIT